jgi:hypothetical protein
MDGDGLGWDSVELTGPRPSGDDDRAGEQCVAPGQNGAVTRYRRRALAHETRASPLEGEEQSVSEEAIVDLAFVGGDQATWQSTGQRWFERSQLAARDQLGRQAE